MIDAVEKLKEANESLNSAYISAEWMQKAGVHSNLDFRLNNIRMELKSILEVVDISFKTEKQENILNG